MKGSVGGRKYLFPNIQSGGVVGRCNVPLPALSSIGPL